MASLYITIRNDLLKMIEGGVYHEGELLPSDSELAMNYGVSRPTAHRAVQSLVDDGYLERRPYHGVVVKPSRTTLGYPGALQILDGILGEKGEMSEARVLYAQTVSANVEISSRLGIPINDDVFRLVRLRYAEGNPNSVAVHFVPLDLYPDIGQVDFERERLYDYFESCGRMAVQANRRIEVALAGGSVSVLLDIPQSDPVFRLYSTAWDESGRVVELSAAVYRGRGNAFEFSANADVVMTRDGVATDKNGSARSMMLDSEFIG